MTRTAAILLALLAASGCASSGPPAVAEVRLVSLSPPAGSELSKDTILVADVEYTIRNFKPGVHYYVAPLFASTKSGTTFNMLGNMAAAPALAQPTGTVTVRYPISGELESRDLKRPVTVWFYVLEETGAGKARVIGQTEELAFRTGG
jgi:hypothetical protein